MSLRQNISKIQNSWGLEHVNFSNLEHFKAVLQEAGLTEFEDRTSILLDHSKTVFIWENTAHICKIAMGMQGEWASKLMRIGKRMPWTCEISFSISFGIIR